MPCRFHYEYFNKAPNSVQILWFKHADSYLCCGISSGVGIRVLSTISPSRGSWDPSLRIDSCATCRSARVAGIVGSVATLHNGEISLIVKQTNGNQRNCELLSGLLVVKLLPWDFKQQLAENLTDGSCLPLNCRWGRWFGAWRKKRVVKGKRGEISKRNTMNCRKLRCTEKIADIALNVGMYAQEKLEGKIPWRRKWIKKQETNNRQRHEVTEEKERRAKDHRYLQCGRSPKYGTVRSIAGQENSSGNGLQIFHWLLTFPAETTQRIHSRRTFSREKNIECNLKKQFLWLHHLLHSLEGQSPQLERREKGLNYVWSSGAKYRISQLQEVTGRQSERMRMDAILQTWKKASRSCSNVRLCLHYRTPEHII